MNISWFEIIAQIINFFIILFLLQKLLYKPVLNAMAERQERIQKSQIEADEKMNEAKELKADYDQKIAELQKVKREMMDTARQEAEDKKDSLLQSYKKEAELKREAYMKEIEDEKEKFLLRLRKDLGSSAVAIASHILDTISSKELEQEMLNRFIRNLQDLEQEMPEMAGFDEETVDIHSARNLSPDEQKQIKEAVQEQLKSVKSVHFETDPSLVMGYELNLQTYTVHANIKSYLSEIERDIIRDLETH